MMCGPWFGRREVAAEAVVAGILSLLCTQGTGHASTRAAQAPSLALQAPAQQRIDSTPTTRGIPPVDAPIQRIDALPVPQAAPITAPPVASQPLVSRDPRSKAIERELQQLQRAAAPSSGYGSTTQAAQAAWQLGLIYLHGAGVRIDRPLAQQWFERAAQQGREPWAFAGLAWCAIDGCDSPPNAAAATLALQRLRAAHPARADFLAWLQAKQLKPLQIAAPEQTTSPSSTLPEFQLLERAAVAGDIQANIELGIIAFSRKQLPQAEAYFRRAASHSAIATHNLNEMQAYARSASIRAAPTAADSAQAALSMARMYHRGQGVPANFAEAVRFYRLADQRGSREAHKMLELIFSRPMPDGSLNVGWMQQLANADPNAPASTLASGANALQMQREPTPLFDLLQPFWQKQVQQIAQ